MVKRKAIWVVVIMVMAISLLAGGCSDSETEPGPGTYTEGPSFDPEKSVATNSFSSLDEFNEFIKKYQGGGNYYYGDLMFRGEAISSVSLPSPVPMEEPSVKYDSDEALGGGFDYSETNVQVAGVDEADILKTDGNYIYTITGNVLFIIKAYPGEEAEIVATIDYEENWPQSLFVNGDHMAVFGNFNDLDFFKDMDFRPTQGMTFFNIYDISDRADPKLVKEYKFEGSYFDARMAGDYIYYVVGNWPTFRPNWPTPVLFDGVREIAMPVKDIYYFNIPYRSPQLVSVHAINIATPSDAVESKSVAAEGGQNLYMSADNIFITYTEYIDEYELRNEILMDLLKDELTAADKELIEKIKATDNDVLSQHEKESKIMQVYYTYVEYLPREEQEDLWDEVDVLLEKKLDEFEYFEFTVISRIAVADGKIEIKGNGKVPGHIMNQFSLDEDTQDGTLRIATTISARWSRFGEMRTETTNSVYALDSNMNIIGKLEGLAETESIYSTRFIGDKLYMVTFRQVDPFFVIDLSDPKNIRELGQLKIPGFSRYLHPYDENTIIGIGQETTDSGRTLGLKISLFDVSDFENPKEIAKFVTEERYADSTALYEHKAFLFSKEKELLVIPAYSYDYWQWDEKGASGATYNGAFVFHITKDEIELRGLIDHSQSISGDYYYYGSLVERSLYIEDQLYTKSPHLLRINELEDLSSVNDITLETDSPDFPIY